MKHRLLLINTLTIAGLFLPAPLVLAYDPDVIAKLREVKAYLHSPTDPPLTDIDGYLADAQRAYDEANDDEHSDPLPEKTCDCSEFGGGPLENCNTPDDKQRVEAFVQQAKKLQDDVKKISDGTAKPLQTIEAINKKAQDLQDAVPDLEETVRLLLAMQKILNAQAQAYRRRIISDVLTQAVLAESGATAAEAKINLAKSKTTKAKQLADEAIAAATAPCPNFLKARAKYNRAITAARAAYYNASEANTVIKACEDAVDAGKTNAKALEKELKEKDR